MRTLRSEWFAKRYAIYGIRKHWNVNPSPKDSIHDFDHDATDEPDGATSKIWRWLNYSDENEEEPRGRSRTRDET